MEIPEFTTVATTVEKTRDMIWNSLVTGWSNALSEATNDPLRLLTRSAYGYHPDGRNLNVYTGHESPNPPTGTASTCLRPQPRAAQ